MNNIVFNIIEMSIRCGVMEEKDKNLYSVAIPSLFFTLFTWGSLIVIGTIFREVSGCLIFLIFHIPLRIYAGGYHQNSRMRCYLQSLVIFGLLMLGAISAVQSWIVNYWMVFMVLSFMVIWKYAPVESMNKPLNEKERKHHKSAARYILLTELVVLTVFKLNWFDTGLYYSTMSILLVAVQLVLGVFEQRYKAV